MDHNLENAYHISEQYHKWQLYGISDDYFQIHILDVLYRAITKANQLWLDDNIITKIKICALLHDVLEDTDIDSDYLKSQIWEENYQNAYILSIKNLDWSKKTKDFYYQSISQNIVTKITKFADRLSNISAIKNLKFDNTYTAKAYKLYDKYNNDMKYIYKYDILPSELQIALDKTKNYIY